MGKTWRVGYPEAEPKVYQRRERKDMEDVRCKKCDGMGHKAWKCPNNQNQKMYGRGRPFRKEGDVEEGPSKKKKY
ncbi:hypothetical protein PRIPAC_97625 [Pristionchus pacificus]|uniref:Uncharacterized protein n=1 Tax=Pristionchus pacificus TaxID=54126 RepID=A0A2A6D1R5_PRIPA|nr:hypothetical protein PRIPAC_97625 [Pristionchus pacificus]|eukprot:PDM84296.1 hypothetical protein PRIPAC_33319 [Pristionchus pacificus]